MEILETFKPGETVIEEGTKGTSAYVILSGTVDVIKRSGSNEMIMATLGQGQVFGEMGLIEDRHRSATVRARSELEVRTINRESFNELLRTKPSILIPIMKSLFERLRQVSDLLAEKMGDEVQETRKEKTWQVIIEGQTAEARELLSGRKRLITKFPFLIGRESLNPDSDVFYNNDLSIREEKPFKVSRNHLAIIKEAGQIWLVDRGSAFGTIVNGRELGGKEGTNRISLDSRENQIVIGPVGSKFIFTLYLNPDIE
jgi:hypothetical protein